MEEVRRWLMFLFSILCVLISIRCLGCSFKEIFRTLKDFLLLLLLNNFDGLYLQVDKRGKRVAKWRT